MRVDHNAHVGRAQVVLRHRVGRVAIDDLPVLEHVVGPPDASVDEDRSRTRVFDHEPVHRDSVQCVDPSQVEANDLHLRLRNEG